jgi:signal transduction histidine kinase
MKSIHSLILGNLRKMLLAALGLAAFLLLAYTYVSFRVSESESVNFVMSHVVSLAQAGVYSQNVAEIDKDVGRFAKAWKDTQDLDLRIDVFLDAKQIGHAGPLQPFDSWSSTTERSLDLPSGQHLVVQLQTDLTKTILWGALLLLIFEGAVALSFYVLMRSMKKSAHEITAPMESTVAWLKAIARNLPESVRVERESLCSGIIEIDDLETSIKTLIEQIALMENHLTNVGLEQARLKFAEQVAHNVKGVIATLQLKISSLSLSQKEKSELLDCVNSLKDISANLVNVKNARNAATVKRHATHLFPLAQTAVFSKRLQFENRYDISLENESEALPCFAPVSAGEFQSMISNLIDNARDATREGGKIRLSLRQERDIVKVSVSDDGKGIPAHVLPRLGLEPLSFEKKNGNGIGLVHARETMLGVGGSLEIESEEGKGATVTLRFPAVRGDASLVTSLEIPRDTILVCVDDDELIHRSLDLKLKPIRESVGGVVHLYSAVEFEDWMEKNREADFGARLYLFDYDLKDASASGLKLIEKYGLGLESVLISGLASDPEIAMEAKRLGVRRLPKDYLSFVPFGVGRTLDSQRQSVQVT